MKNLLKNKLVFILSALFALLVAEFWTAFRVIYSGLIQTIGPSSNPSPFAHALPILLLVLAWVNLAYAVFGGIFFQKKWTAITMVIFPFLLLVLIVVMSLLGAIDYYDFILPKFFKLLGITSLILFFAIILFVNFDNRKSNLAIKSGLLAVVIFCSVFVGYEIKLNKFTYEAVVYAVEDEYQITFSTSDTSIAWVEIDGKNYYDTAAGSIKSKDLIHKVHVPQSILDEAKTYSIHAKQVVYRGPFNGIMGKELTKSYKFDPVDSSDGLTYYTISDAHGSYKGAINAARSAGKLDFLVLLGDITSMTDNEQNATEANKIAHAITKGEYPVVYTHGNHEIKGAMAEELSKYVGSKNGDFFYTVSLGDAFIINLDLGEDHEDDWWEFYGTADFDTYRNEQTKFLDELIKTHPYDSYSYKLALCHIPVQYMNGRKDFEELRTTWVEKLNTIGIDLMLSGHTEELNVFEPNLIEANSQLTYNPNLPDKGGKKASGILTNFNFPGFIVARAANSQQGKEERVGKSAFTGLLTVVDLTQKQQTSKFINAKGEIVPIVSLYGTTGAKESFTFPIH